MTRIIRPCLKEADLGAFRPFFFDCAVFQGFSTKKPLRPKLTQAEGFVIGVGVKMFTIAGPVIVYGTVASVIYFVTTLF